MSKGDKSGDDLLKGAARLCGQGEELKPPACGRKQAEGQSWLEQIDWATTFNAMSDWVSVIDLEARVLRSNSAVGTLLGIEEDEAVGRTCCELVHGNGGPLPGCPLARMLESHSRETAEISVPDTGRWFSVTVDPVKDDAGGLVGALHIVRDITERRRAQKALLDSQKQHARDLEYLSKTALEFVALPPSADIYEHIARRLKEIAGSSIVVVNSLDEGSGLLECRSVLGLGRLSRSVLKLIGRNPMGMRFAISEEAREGLSKGEPVKVPGGLYVLALEQIPEAACKAIEKLLGIGDIYATGIAKEGELLGSAILMTRTRAELKNRTVVQTFVSQASTALQHRRTEEALRESEQRHRELFEGMSDGAMVLSSQGCFVEVNEVTLQDLGYSREEFLRLSPADIVHPDFHQAMKDNQKKLWRGEPTELESAHRRKDGRVMLVEVHARKIEYRGEPAILTLVRDITERKRAEERIRADRARLRSLASELVLAEERERRHVAMWLHDNISQKLALSRMALGALQAETSPEEMTHALKEVRDGIDRAIEDIRSMTFELGSPVLYEVGLAAAVERLAEEFQEKFDITCGFEDDGLPKPLGEDIRVILYRGVRELLINIVKHARATGVKIGMRKDGKTIRIDVVDDGIGLAALEHSQDSRSGGFGLFSIRERLSHVGGELRTESGRVLAGVGDEHGGTRVTLVAPLEQGKASRERYTI